MPTTYAIPNGRTVMDATTYTANGGVQTVNNSDTGSNGFYPDFIWTKPRSITANHQLVDSVRGSQYFLYSNLTNSEGNNSQFVTGFNSNGFGLGTANYGSGTTMVAWQWNAGSGTTSSNTNGSITSTVSVNATAGFSIVSWTATGSVATVGHGLGAKPSLIITKQRSITGDWAVLTDIVTGTPQYMYLNTTQAIANTGWGTNPTSTVFSGYSYPNGQTIISYCWAPVAGFSQFGSYTGNGSTSGPFVYTGFRPRWLMIKNATTAGYDWNILDTARDPYNTASNRLYADLSQAETSAAALNVLSNGFNITISGAGFNNSGDTYIYMAFAENPLKFANAR